MGRRALRNLCLAFLMDLADESARRLCVAQLESADNMTDAMAALTALANCDCPERRPALDAFYAKWQDEPLVVDKWLGVEALSRLPDTVARVRGAHGASGVHVERIPTRSTRCSAVSAGTRQASMLPTARVTS